jgi:carboxyl-terminal processing protease
MKFNQNVIARKVVSQRRASLQMTTPFRALRHTLGLGGLTLASLSLTVLTPSMAVQANLPARSSFQDSPKAIVDEAWQLVNRHYVDGTFNQVDWQATRKTLLSRNYTSKEEAYQAIRAALKPLNDPYTRFMTPADYAALTTQTSGELSGIGIHLGKSEESKNLVVVSPIPNSPASKAGILSGDQLLAINGQPTDKMTVEQASNLIRGKAGTPITLSLSRANRGQFDVNLVRAVIELPAVNYQVRQEGAERVGYIHLSEFNAHAAEQMRAAIQDLSRQKVQGFVLDLRGNPGGLLQSGVEISRMWLDKGLIVRTVDRDGHSEPLAANRTALTQLPLVVLVDGNSASCSEIVTGALQDNQRAVIVGSKTFGKALVQSIHELSDKSGLAVTIAHYYTPSGGDINHKGIVPDVQVNIDPDQMRALQRKPDLFGTNADPQYSRAVASLKGQILANPPGRRPQANLPQVTN